MVGGGAAAHASENCAQRELRAEELRAEKSAEFARRTLALSSAFSMAWRERARPKSAIFIRHSESSSRFDGFMSRGTRSAECMYSSALNVWYMMYCLCIRSRMFARITACRSVSMYSKIR